MVFESYSVDELKSIVINKLGSFYLNNQTLYLSTELKTQGQAAPIGLTKQSKAAAGSKELVNSVDTMLSTFLKMCEAERDRFESLEDAAKKEQEGRQDAAGDETIVKPNVLPPRVLSLMIQYQASSMDHLAKAIYKVILEVRQIEFKHGEAATFESTSVVLDSLLLMQAILAEAARQSGPLRKAAKKVEEVGVTQFIEENTEKLVEVSKKSKVPFDTNSVAVANKDYKTFLACGRDRQTYANKIWANAIKELQDIAKKDPRAARVAVGQPESEPNPKSAKSSESPSSRKTTAVPAGNSRRSQSGK